MNKRLKVWWIPQVPMKPFEVEVKNIEEAKLLLNTLADYDIFQYENNIKPDYCNTGGLSEFDPEDYTDGILGSWTEWCNDDGETIDDVMNREREKEDE